MRDIFLIGGLALASCFVACKKKAPENIPQPKAGTEAAARSSTETFKEAGPLDAPGDYLKTTVGRIGEAKAAKTLYENTARERFGGLEAGNTGGN